MADDWDLAAVVRSCKTDASSAAASAAAADTGRSTGLPSDALSCLASLTFEEEKDQFSFPNIIHQNDDQYYSSRTGYTNHGFQELQQLIKPIIFCKNDIIGGGASSVPSSSSLNHINIGQQHHHHHLRHVNIIRPTPPPPNNNFNLRPASDFGGFIQGMQKRELDQSLQEQQPNHPVPSNIPAFLNSQPQATRIRKRKSQQKRTVCHVTAENLSNDVWAWRKYGQKPIKGSPYPRNYYRCSSSKGCPARKQVERSNTDPNVFVITYSGDHTHPRPTHRNSLAGSTRHKYSSQPEKELPAPSKLSPDPDHIMPTNSSSLSPTTPLRVLKEELADHPHQATHLKETITTTSIDAGDQDMDINIDDDPNQVLDQELIMADSDDQEDGSMMEMSASTDHDDIFLGLQELDSSPI